MAKHGKNYKNACKDFDKQSIKSINDGLADIKKLAFAKFDETVDVNISLGIDPAKADQMVRGSVILPNNVSKPARVIVFAGGEYSDQAEKAGADFVGTEDLIEKVSKGWMDFDYAVATPDIMGKVGKLAKILGPKGLLPNKKLGTVTFEVANIVSELKKGRTFFKNDKAGLVHFKIGKLSQDADAIKENLSAFIKALVSSKPVSSKGVFLKKLTISSTMGVGITIDTQSVLKA